MKHSPLRLLPATETAFRFLLRLDLVIVQPVVGRAKAMAKPDHFAAFLRPARETDFHRVVGAASFVVRFLPVTDLFAVVLFGRCCRPICLATAGFVPAADPFDPADSGLAVVAAAVADLFDPSDLSDLSAADLSAVAAGPGCVGPAVFASGLACSVCSFEVALGKGMVVVAVPFCFLTHRSSF